MRKTSVFDYMKESNTSTMQQYHHEHQTWERALDFYKQENAYLKTRLSQVLDNKIDKDFLTIAEQFQNQFIKQDEFINELKYSIHEVELACKEEIILGNNSFNGEIKRSHNSLRVKMDGLENNFMVLKKDFNKYISSIL